MEAELKEEWVAELRSGKWKQGAGTLVSPDGYYCCLGVLCEILVNKGRLSRVENSGLNGGFADKTPEALAEYAVLPPETAKELFGMVNVDGYTRPNVTGIYDIERFNADREDRIPDGEPTGTLAVDNDRGKSFAEIADIIEEHF